MDHVTTTGSGAAAGVPDAMQVTVAVEVTAPTVAEALAGVAEGAQSAGEVARRHTDESRISTGGFSVHPGREHHDWVGYRAWHELHILCGLSDAGQLVTDLAEAVGDLLRVNGVQPVVTDTEALLEQARQLAFADARAKASEFAALAGRSLGPVLRMAEGAGHDRRVRAVSASAGRNLSFEPGSVDTAESVTVRWALLD